MSEPATVKARRLLTSGHVHIADVVEAVVEGDAGRHVVIHDGTRWTCDCEAYRFRRRCSHQAAVVLVTSPPRERREVSA